MHGQITEYKIIDYDWMPETAQIQWTSLDGKSKLSVNLPVQVAPEFEMYQRVTEEGFYTSLGGYKDEVRAVK